MNFTIKFTDVTKTDAILNWTNISKRKQPYNTPMYIGNFF